MEKLDEEGIWKEQNRRNLITPRPGQVIHLVMNHLDRNVTLARLLSSERYLQEDTTVCGKAVSLILAYPHKPFVIRLIITNEVSSFPIISS